MAQVLRIRLDRDQAGGKKLRSGDGWRWEFLLLPRLSGHPLWSCESNPRHRIQSALTPIVRHSANPGEELIISKRGKPVAKLVAAKADKPWLALRGKGRFHGAPEDAVVRVDEIEALKP